MKTAGRALPPTFGVARRQPARLSALEAWIGEVEAVVTPQLERRDHPRSTGALETALRDVKKSLTLQRRRYGASTD